MVAQSAAAIMEPSRQTIMAKRKERAVSILEDKKSKIQSSKTSKGVRSLPGSKIKDSKTEGNLKNHSKTEGNIRNQSKIKKVNLSNDHKANLSEKKQENSDNEIDFSIIESKILEGIASLEKQRKGSGGKSKPSNKNAKIESSLNKRTTDRNNIKKTVSNKERERKSDAGENKIKTNKHSDQKRKETKTSSRSTPISSKSYKQKDSLSKDRKKSMNKSKIKQESDESGMSDWEELEDVDELALLLGDARETVAHDAGDKEVVAKIELDAPDLMWGMKKRKKRTEQDMIEDYLRKCANQSIREVWENMHKTHLLCLFAHGNYINMNLNSELLLGSALSIVTDRKVYPPKRLDIKYLESFTSWFARKIMLIPQKLDKIYWNTPIEEVLQDRFEQKKAYSHREFVFMFILLSRALGMNVRLVLTLLPISWKPSMDNLIRPKKKEEDDLFKDECSAGSSTAGTSQAITMDMVEGLKSREKHQKKEKENPNKEIKNKTKDKNSRKMLSTDSEDSEKKNKKTKSKKRKSSKDEYSDDSCDDDFDPEILKLKKGPKNTKKNKDSEKKQNKRKAEEHDKEEESRKRKKDGLTEWAEIYVEEEEKWVCVDVFRGKIHCIAEIESRVPPPLAYVTAFNADQTVKDITPKYNSTWLSSEDKLRCSSGWWSKSIRPFRGARTRRDREEDKEMQQSLEKAPLPPTISQYKNHPMYALQRHILKYEAIYPPDQEPLGFIKKEPVFPRDAVKTLRSRNLWEREARSVRTEEEPFKIVKAMPKWDKATRTTITDRPLELFGEWQTEPYDPPVAKDGKVPRNEYGNVELYKQCMMPRGCIQLFIPGLNRLCRKIDIDCAPAMTGFEYHKGGMHPIYEGFIICEEYKDIVLDAWNQEQEILAQKEEEKRQRRIYDNWKRLIKRMLLKERVRERYGKMTPEELEEEELKQLEAEERKREVEKKRIKQSDLDAAVPQDEAESRPQMVTHHVPQFKIDLTCSVVEMAKRSREFSMKSKNSIRKKTVRRKESVKNEKSSTEVSAASDVKAQAEVSTLDSDEEEEDPEEKKARIRSILNWGKEITANPELSEDSDNENSKDSSSGGLDFSGFLSPKRDSSHPYRSTISKAVSTAKGKLKKQVRKRKKSELKEAVASDRSTTPEPEMVEHSSKERRQPRRSAIQKKTYKESEEESEADISIDESDCDDKTYNPKKDKFANTKFVETIELSEESD